MKQEEKNTYMKNIHFTRKEKINKNFRIKMIMVNSSNEQQQQQKLYFLSLDFCCCCWGKKFISIPYIFLDKDRRRNHQTETVFSLLLLLIFLSFHRFNHPTRNPKWWTDEWMDVSCHNQCVWRTFNDSTIQKLMNRDHSEREEKKFIQLIIKVKVNRSKL